MPYSSVAKMKADERYNFPWLDPENAEMLSLNGTWSLNWVKSTAERPGKDGFWGTMQMYLHGTRLKYHHALR
jgi:hypothetical protein